MIAIAGILYAVALPTYERYVLKSYFDEAKLVIQSLLMAQERYKAKYGHYYASTENAIRNELMIFNNLDVDLSQTNNFNFQIHSVEDRTTGEQFKIRGFLRRPNIGADCDTQPTTEKFACKQNGTADADEWVYNYVVSDSITPSVMGDSGDDSTLPIADMIVEDTSPTYNKLYIEVRYPELYTHREYGINYNNIYKD